MSKKFRNTKQALLDRKKELLNELQYYKHRIQEARSKTNNIGYYDDSSDSEIELNIDIGPSASELQHQRDMLTICLQATQELTSVEILESEVNIMVKDPVFKGEPPVTECGTWKEVLVECKVDLVPFSMTFFSHHADRLFGPVQYRCLQVTPARSAHEKELSKSVLPEVTTPSDAVQVLRNYARAHRSRRTTLSDLVKKYGESLYMEPLFEGGYLLKCANLLEVSWILQNKWSYIAPFHHKMSFNMEYVDESYVKIIKQAHKQLSDPSVDTDERTLLLDQIIGTCLKAQRETTKTDGESDTNTLDRETDNVNKNRDSNIMAPPKTIPKKVRSNKRRNDEDTTVSKKPRTDNKENLSNEQQIRKNEHNPKGDKFFSNDKKNVSSKKDKVEENCEAEVISNSDKVGNKKLPSAKNKDNLQLIDNAGSTENVAKSKDINVQTEKKRDNSKQNKDKTESDKNKNIKNDGNTQKTNDGVSKTDKDNLKQKVVKQKKAKPINNIERNINNIDTKQQQIKEKRDKIKSKESENNIQPKSVEAFLKQKEPKEKKNKIKNNSEITNKNSNAQPNVASSKNDNMKSKENEVIMNKNSKNSTGTANSENANENANVASSKNKDIAKTNKSDTVNVEKDANVARSKNKDVLKTNKENETTDKGLTKSSKNHSNNKNDAPNLVKNKNNNQNLKTKLKTIDKNLKKLPKVNENKVQTLMHRFSRTTSVAKINAASVASNRNINSPKNISKKITSKIPQRVNSLVHKKMLRLSPRLLKKPSQKPRI